VTLLGGCAASPRSNDRPPPFDVAWGRYQDAAEELRDFDPGGTIVEIDWSEDGRLLRFTRDGERLAFNLETRALRGVAEAEEDDDPDRRRDRRPRPARGRQYTSEPSPDGRWNAVCRDWNVVIESVDGAQERVVTTNGSRKFRYGSASWVYGEELRQRRAMWWSPDSTKLAFYEFDEREVPDFHLVDGWTELRTEPMREGYPKAGDPNPQVALLVFDFETGGTVRLERVGDPDEEWYIYRVRFSPDGEELLFHQLNRRQNVLHLVAADPETGSARIVLSETQQTWQDARPTWRFLNDGRRFIWASERTGLEQYELWSLDGARLSVLTDNDGPVSGIEHLDEDAGLVYYTAYDAALPLNERLWRVKLDGTGQQQLTRGDLSHRVAAAPDGRWFVARRESLTTPPTTVLLDAEGREVATLAESDRDRIAELGWPEPELFTIKAADGETDLFGWLYTPRDFDPSRRYPLLIDVYGGPGSKGVRNRFRPAIAACELGFVIAKVDNRGTGGRGKAFLGSVYGRLGTVDLADQAAAVRKLITRSYVDPDRVGIYGHSYGGFMASLAILKYPELFRAAVAGAPVTDWRNYDSIYTERYMGLPHENEAGYDAGSCLTHADRLEGHLLLQHGLVDDNVHPNNTFQLVEKLHEAEKWPAVTIHPTRGHGLGGLARKERWRFLYEHLVEHPDPPQSSSPQ
jgi:dipeptidyl-peptidase-4